MPSPPASVIWLTPLENKTPLPNKSGQYVLTQKNKQFTPHLMVIPAGSVVGFPNQDPYFHNVFSLFNGRRFDLGLYEAGSTRSVRFTREGVSYVFCNIHPEMSAVILALSTPYFAVVENGKILRFTMCRRANIDCISGQRARLSSPWTL